MPRPKSPSWEPYAHYLAQQGLKDAAKALADEFGPPPPLCSEVDVRRLLQRLEQDGGEGGDLKPADLQEASIHRCLVEFALSNAKVTRWLKSWATVAKVELASNNGFVAAMPSVAPPRHTRRPITDPEVLARRNEALAKARAARAERLAAHRQTTTKAEEEAAINASAPDQQELVEVG